MTNPFVSYVAGFDTLLASGAGLSVGYEARPQLPEVALDAPVCMVFSPHPDDEAISGALPWRLRTQARWRVLNVALTLGSNKGRRAARWHELEQCCAYLGFELVSASGEPGRGFEVVSEQAADDDPAHWAGCVARVADLITRHQPRLIVCPHGSDGHAAHIGTHRLVMEALRTMGSEADLSLALSEYWNTQSDPGLMVELGTAEVADLVAALSLHVGEVARNPYHLTLPAWFIDSVRRGAERMGAPGGSAPDFRFASLYGWKRWHQGRCDALPATLLPLGEQPDLLFVPGAGPQPTA
jgi:LmbE family N-acetylglucosaminyl deacetylase